MILFPTLLLLQVRDSVRPICGVALVGPLQLVRSVEFLAMKALDLPADPSIRASPAYLKIGSDWPHKSSFSGQALSFFLSLMGRVGRSDPHLELECLVPKRRWRTQLKRNGNRYWKQTSTMRE